MIDWFNDNKEILFGGAGAAIIAYVLNVLWNRISVKPRSEKQWRACISYLPDFLLSRLTKPLYLEKLVNIDLRPRGDSIDMNLGELPSTRIWLQITNHSPFDLKVSCIAVEVWCGAATIDINRVESIEIKAHTTNNDIVSIPRQSRGL